MQVFKALTDADGQHEQLLPLPHQDHQVRRRAGVHQVAERPQRLDRRLCVRAQNAQQQRHQQNLPRVARAAKCVDETTSELSKQ